MPSTLNGPILSLTVAPLLLEAITSFATASNRMKRCSDTGAHIFFIKLPHLHIASWLPTEMPSAQQTDSTCLQLMDLNCHVFTSLR